jgi:SAM-dependent methyltransferase
MKAPTYENLIPSHKFSPRDVFNDEGGREEATKLLTNLFHHLDIEVGKANVLTETVVALGMASDSDDEFERRLKAIVSEGDLPQRIERSHAGRSEQIFSQIAPHLDGESTADIGAGDGKVGKMVADTGQEVRLLDVIDYNETDLLLEIFDGDVLPLDDDAVETSLLLTVLHHCEHPEKVLDEAIRVTRRQIIIIESVYNNEPERMLQTFLDWFYNRVLRDGVNCPYNFNSPEGWREVFRAKGLTLVDEEDLGRDQPTAPERHWKFVVEKCL